MSRSITLRIKRKFFDQILAGTKLVEYRDDKEYYRRLFDGQEISQLVLHYQSGRKLRARVDSINLIDAPKHLSTTGIKFTPKVFALVLRNAQLV